MALSDGRTVETNPQAGDYVIGETLAPAETVLFSHENIQKFCNRIDGSDDFLDDTTYIPFREISNLSAGETLAQWDLVYLKSDGKVWLADADASEAEGNALGMVTTAASADDPVTVIISGIIREDTWAWTIGAVLYVDDATAGGMTETAPATSGDVIKRVARALSADHIFLDVGMSYALAP